MTKDEICERRKTFEGRLHDIFTKYLILDFILHIILFSCEVTRYEAQNFAL